MKEERAIELYKVAGEIEIDLPGREELRELCERTSRVLTDFKDRNPDIDPMEMGGYRIYLQVIGNVVKPMERGENPTGADIEDGWRVYSFLCYKFGHIPTRSDFEIAMGKKLNWNRWFGEQSDRGEVLQRIWKECDAATMQHAVEHNSIGGIYASKAIYGHLDSQPQVVVVNNNMHESADDIAKKYGLEMEDEEG